MVDYVLCVRDSDGAILTSQRGTTTFNKQKPGREYGPFGDKPFANANNLKAGYSPFTVQVVEGDSPPRGDFFRVTGRAVRAATPAEQTEWAEAIDPRGTMIQGMRDNPNRPVTGEQLLAVLGL